MKRFCLIGLTALAIAGVAVAEDIPWTYDTSKRVPETVSSGQATLAPFDSRCTGQGASAADAFDSRWSDWGESEPRGLDSTPAGAIIIVR